MEISVVEVFHPYRAQEKHQLTIAVGEKLTVVEKDPSGWWVGRNAKGHVGVFPSTYTKKATTVAPTAEVTREVISARILAELGIDQNAAGRDHKLASSMGSSGSSRGGFVICTDLDYDDVYAMTNSELEREIKTLVSKRDHERRRFTEALDRVVEETLQQRKVSSSSSSSGMGSGASPGGVNLRDAEAQRLRIGKKRLEELIVAESQSKQELRETIELVKAKGIAVPASIAAPQVMASLIGAQPSSATSTPPPTPLFPLEALPSASAAEASSPTTGPSGDGGDDEWLQGVTDVSLIPYLKHLQKELVVLNSALDEMEPQMDSLNSKMCTLESEVNTKQDTLEQLADSHQQLVKELFEHWESRVTAAQQEYAQLKNGGNQGPRLVAALQDQIQLLEKQVENGKKQYEKTQGEVTALQQRLQQLEEMDALRAQAETMIAEAKRLESQEAASLQEIRDVELNSKKQLAEDQALYRKLERQRRETYNKIQELKGNLRVYCRIKPCGANETGGCVQAPDDMTIRVYDPETEQTQEFEFDLAIPEKSTQEEIFEEVRPLATSVLDGYNVCIFAYGQTGSGKTYTMEGPPDNRGINFRAVRELFVIARDRGEDYNCTLRVSILEVYNDKLFDLQNKRSPCKVRWGGEEQGVVIEPMIKHVVFSVDDVQNALEKAYLSRSVAGTDCNAHSSRSHCILTVYVDATNNSTNQTVTGKLHLIDLAGSERVKHSGVEGDRLKEATHINTSLTHLKTVIQGLATKSSFVAYRNSTLTSMLQDSLGGNCKCLMFANVSPASHNVPESVCTMKYAAEARKVEVGKVSANVKKR